MRNTEKTPEPLNSEGAERKPRFSEKQKRLLRQALEDAKRYVEEENLEKALKEIEWVLTKVPNDKDILNFALNVISRMQFQISQKWGKGRGGEIPENLMPSQEALQRVAYGIGVHNESKTPPEADPESIRDIEQISDFTKHMELSRKRMVYMERIGASPEELTQLKLTILKSISDIGKELNVESLKKERMSKQQQEALGVFFGAQADLLSQLYPRRKVSVWQYGKISNEPEYGESIGNEEGLPVQVNSAERARLNIHVIDPVQMLDGLTDALVKSTDEAVAGLESMEKDSEEYSKKLERIADQKKATELAIKIQSILRQHKGPVRDPDFDPKKAPEKIKELTDELLILIANPNLRNEENKLVVDISSQLISDPENLLGLAAASRQNEEWPNPVAKLQKELIELYRKKNAGENVEDQIRIKVNELNEEMSKSSNAIDPRVEALVKIKTLEFYIKAVEMNPESVASYVSLFGYMEKIKYGNFAMISKFTKKLKEIKAIKDEEGRNKALRQLGETLIKELNDDKDFLKLRKIAPEIENKAMKKYLEFAEIVLGIPVLNSTLAGLLPIPPEMADDTHLFSEYIRRREAGQPDAEGYLPEINPNF